jgi:hypothetical protein
MGEWQRYLWADEATEATVAVVGDGASDATTLLQRLGPTEDAGSMTLDAALHLQGSFYDDGTFDDRAVFQVGPLSGTHGGWWGLVEPNGFRASFDSRLLALADGGPAVSFFWNVNAVMSLLRVERGRVVATFDPLLDVEQATRHAADLPFDDHPSAAAFALIERWTGITITEAWFVGTKPTFLVQTATP